MAINKLIPLENEADVNKNSLFVQLLFASTILFQVTALKFIWSLEGVARIANLSVLVLLIGYSIKVIGSGLYSKKMWRYYLLPGVMIVCGMFLNISINALSNLKLISFFGLTLPWVTYLAIPSLMKKEAINTETLWRYFYYFMLWANILGLLDYLLLFAGFSSMRVLNTPFGVFLGGKFSLLHMLEDGTAHYRYYACFMEPGTLAMFLLPAIAYAFFYKKYISLFIFFVAFFLTDSLGGVISLILLIAVVLFVKLNRKKKYLAFAIFALFIISVLLWIALGETVMRRYELKNNSAAVREQSFTKTLSNFPILLINYPLGIKLEENTENFDKNKLYTGSNFLPGNYLQTGGILAFFGYLMCLFVTLTISIKSIKRFDLTLEGKVVFSSILVLLPFIFQRTTIWECSLFALLFAPSIIRVIQSKT